MGDLKINTNDTKTTDSIYVQAMGLSSLSTEDDKFSLLSTSQLLAKGEIPPSHRRIADNFMIIKKIYGQPVINSRPTQQDNQLLAKYDFNPLEYSTIKQVNEELSFLKKWSRSLEEELQKDADRILEIRAKELKFLLSSRYATISNEIYNGFLALEKYFEDISKYN